MGLYRTSRPMTVDALQCTEARTISTDLGFINVKQGDWVVCGEGGEIYIVDNAFFQRTFLPTQDQSSVNETHAKQDTRLEREPSRAFDSLRPRAHRIRACHRPRTSRRKRPLSR